MADTQNSNSAGIVKMMGNYAGPVWDKKFQKFIFYSHAIVDVVEAQVYKKNLYFRVESY